VIRALEILRAGPDLLKALCAKADQAIAQVARENAIRN
jgi:hypothetical protein